MWIYLFVTVVLNHREDGSGGSEYTSIKRYTVAIDEKNAEISNSSPPPSDR